MTRWRCRKAGALTTRVASTRRSPAPSNSNGMSSTTSFSPRRAARFRKARWRWPTSGWTMASSRRSASLLPNTRAPSAWRSSTPSFTTPGNAASIAGKRHAALGLDGVDVGVGVVDRHAHLPQHLRRSRLAHADGAGKADDHHRLHPWRSCAVRHPHHAVGDMPPTTRMPMPTTGRYHSQPLAITTGAITAVLTGHRPAPAPTISPRIGITSASTLSAFRSC